MLVLVRTRRTLTKNGRKKVIKILNTLKNMRSSKREHVFRHISFVNKLLQDHYFTRHKLTGDDMFNLFHETLGEHVCSCWNTPGLWSKTVEDLRISTTLKHTDAIYLQGTKLLSSNKVISRALSHIDWKRQLLEL